MNARVGTATAMAVQAAAAREASADRLFDVSAVLQAIDAASGQGRTWLRLSNPERVDLTGTKAWRRLLRRLAELGYVARQEWIMPLPGEDEELKHSALVIGWNGGASGMKSPLELLPAKYLQSTDQ